MGMHQPVGGRTRAKLQELASKCCSRHVVVASATRIESSSIWSKYVAFKRKLYAKLSAGHDLEESELELVNLLGGSEQAIAPGRRGFPMPRDIDGVPVLTRKMLEGESASEALST